MDKYNYIEKKDGNQIKKYYNGNKKNTSNNLKIKNINTIKKINITPFFKPDLFIFFISVHFYYILFLFIYYYLFNIYMLSKNYSTLHHLPIVVFIIGGPCSGKGTLGTLLNQRLGYTHLSAGNLLR
jgi:hypothetical protein